ncbi:phosphoribosylaminoimidazolesuccinocarboxamide synthase [Prochlorothrix hollandica]|uniref:phosphoribosylaminoimidazolesuccinocarboxamide synthase n=1 Tax=Prochlorothrix hollandica TaxID=1223 RepID=UPI003340E946
MALRDRQDIQDLIHSYGATVDQGRSIRQLLADGEIPALKGCQLYPGKVSDCIFGDPLQTPDGIPLRLMYRTNRVSTHDQHRGSIPFKDQVLALNHHLMLDLVQPILGSSQLEIPGLEPTATVIVAENLNPIAFENVLRCYMAKSTTSTSLYQHWLAGAREFCGHALPDNLQGNGKLPYIMDTPSTKAKADQSVAPQYLFDRGICTPEDYTQIRNSSILAFGLLMAHDRPKGLIPVDTKLEHGRNHQGAIVVMDEVFTLDSTRRWKLDPATGELELDAQGNPQSYSKEFVRGMAFDPSTGLLNPHQQQDIAVRYIEAIQHISGQPFEPDLRSREQRLLESTHQILDHLGIA